MNKAFFEAILSILSDCWEKFICSSLPARLMEDDAILDIKSIHSKSGQTPPAAAMARNHTAQNRCKHPSN